MDWLVMRFFELNKTLIAVSPKPVQKWWLVNTLRFYRKCYDYLLMVIKVYYNGVSPKTIYDWGMHKFFLAHIGEGMSILDVGCGAGDLTKWLAQKASRIVAYDSNLSKVTIARQTNWRPNIEYFVGEAQAALPQARFDRVVLSSILTFVDDADFFLQRLHQVTDTLLIRETRYDNCYTVLLGEELGVKKWEWKEYTRKELVELLSRNGWGVVQSWDTYDMFLVAQAV